MASFQANSRFAVGDLARLVRLSVTTVRRHIRAGNLAATRVGKQIRISHSDLNRYLGSAGHVSDKQTDCQAVSPIVVAVAANEFPSSCEVSGQTLEGLMWRIIRDDVCDGLRQVPAQSVDCAVTSPPYYWQRDYEVDGQLGHEASIDGYVDALVRVFRELNRTLAADGTFFLNLGDTYYSAKGKPHGRDDKHNGRQMMRAKLRAVDGPGLGLPRKSLIGIPWRVALAMQNDGWTLRSSIIWHRPGSLPEPTAHDRPWRTVENVFLFSKGPRYFFNRKGLANEEDVWRLAARPENPGSHFAPFPRELVARCLACGCKPGGTVIDPFVGSGTTMMAALESGRHAIGVELKGEYCEFARKRIEKEFGTFVPKLRRA